MRILHCLAAASAIFAAVPAAASTTIDFQASSSGFQSDPLTIGDATFSSSGGGLYVADFLGNSNLSLCSVSGSSCAGSLGVSFAAAVSGVSFTVFGDDSASTLTLLLTLADSSTTTALFTLDGNIYSSDLINLSSYGNVSSFTVASNDFFGVAFDNFTFSAAAAATPEPMSWIMLILGFGIAGAALRRRRSVEALAA